MNKKLKDEDIIEDYHKTVDSFSDKFNYSLAPILLGLIVGLAIGLLLMW